MSATQGSGSATPRGRATIYDVAQAADVSHQTVSRFVKGGTVRPAARERIEAAIRELDYHPNLTARSLATSRSHRVGALANEMLEVGPSAILQGASNAARDAGYLLDIVSLDPADPSSAHAAVALLDQHDLAAVLAIAPTEAARRVLEDERLSVPLYVDAQQDDTAADEVRSVNGRGVLLALEHLLALGHSRIVLLTGPTEWLVTRNVVHAYFTRMAAAGLAAFPPVTGAWTPRSGRDAVDRLPWESGFTAVVAANDQMALGLLSGLAARGVGVPAQVSVVGFDDIPESAYLVPALTTVHVDFAAQGRRAFQRVLALIDPAAAAGTDVAIDPTLVVRDSSGPAPR